MRDGTAASTCTAVGVKLYTAVGGLVGLGGGVFA